jgi:glycosyltransferase involved in cell wall biosynthesis
MFLTIIVRVFNREDTIQRCLKSVLSQTKINDIQILIIDDGSTDNSVSIINNIKNNNQNALIDIISHKENMGRGKALNTAKEYIKGKYCCILDSDDTYNRNTWVEELQNEISNKTYDILYSGIESDWHVKHIYNSEMFKKCPIPNFNFYEDHYTKFFLNPNKNIHRYKYKMSNFYTICYDSIDRKTNIYNKTQYNHFDYNLWLLFEEIFYGSEKCLQKDLINKFKQINPDKFSPWLLETYNEIKEKLNNP